MSERRPCETPGCSRGVLGTSRRCGPCHKMAKGITHAQEGKGSEDVVAQTGRVLPGVRDAGGGRGDRPRRPIAEPHALKERPYEPADDQRRLGVPGLASPPRRARGRAALPDLPARAGRPPGRGGAKAGNDRSARPGAAPAPVDPPAPTERPPARVVGRPAPQAPASPASATHGANCSCLYHRMLRA